MEKELAVISKVDLRIALAETDEQFEKSVGLYLCPLLLKLNSPFSEVREAVLKIFANINTRITYGKTIKLPAVALLKQAKSVTTNESNPFGTSNQTLVYLQKAVDRMNDEEKRLLLPDVLHGISKQSISTSAYLFSVFRKLIHPWKAPEFESMEYQGLLKDLDFESFPEDEAFVAQKIAKFFMLQPFIEATQVRRPGLTTDDVLFFGKTAGISELSHVELSEVKRDFIEFLKVGFRNENLKILLLIASSDSSSVINDPAEMAYKKLNVNLEDSDYVDCLVTLFVGTADSPPAKPELQEKVMMQLLRSKVATHHSEVYKVTDLGLASVNSKLKQATIQFIKWISENNQQALEKINESMYEFNLNIARKLKETILNEGWPQLHVSGGLLHNSAITQRQAKYEALSDVLKTNPDLFLKNFEYIEFLLDSLEGESIDLRSTILEGLSSLTVHIPYLADEGKQALKQLAYKYLSNDDSKNANIHASRFVILKFINCAFPFNDGEARYLNVLGSYTANRPETIEEANKGLHPHWFNINQSSNTREFKSTSELLGKGNKVTFPAFKDLIQVVESNFKDAQPDNIIFKCVRKAIEFLIQTLVMEAVDGKSTVIIVDEEWCVRLERALELDTVVRDYTRESIKHSEGFRELLSLVFESFKGQYDQGSGINQDITLDATFAKLLSLAPSEIVGTLSEFINPFLSILNERTLHDISLSNVAKSIGIIASHPVNDSQFLVALLAKLLDADLPAHKSKANLLVTGYLISRLCLRNRLDILETVDFNKFGSKIIISLNDTSCYYQALESIGELALYGVLGPELKLVPELFHNEALKVIEPKVKKSDEKSALILSYISLSSPEKKDELTKAEQLLYDTHTSKQTEYLFTSGEAFLILASGWHSKVLKRALDIQDVKVQYIPEDTSRLSFLLNKILIWCSNTKPSLRRAGCIWLLSLVDFCNDSPVIKQTSQKIHLTFMKFLADRDELVQESASRGLSLVYELGDVELKETLVKGLLKSFTDTNSTSNLISGTVEEDTELFDSDLLKTHDGSVSTYRDVLNLAQDVGDPSLVYKFMSLAKSSALWSSRKGVAFGLGSILSKTSLDDMLSKNQHLANRLIPKLYRYRYDPSTSVSTSMNDIWNVLVEDSNKTIKQHFPDILSELLRGMGNKEWRVRQASTTALNDLLNVVEFEIYEPKLEDIWNMSFRVMDDIKESVRQEGNKVTKLLSNVLINNKKTGEGLDKLIPFLLGNKGLLSDAEDIRNFALNTILKLIKGKSTAIKKYIPTLLENFIGLMSTLEPEIINYLILNADKYNIKNNDIDAKRLQSLGHSPMMDATEKLVDQLDFDNIDASVNAIISSIKKAVGLPSKVCGSKILISLVNKKYELIKPYGDELLKVAINQIKDKNDTIATSYSISVGYLGRLASIDLIVLYGKKLKSMYLESEDERPRLIASIASENFSRYSNEKFEMVASEFLPLTFIGTNDIEKSVAKNFEKQWVETTSGSNILKLYLREIIDLMSAYIKSPNYIIRQILAKSVVKLTNEINDFSNLSEGLVTSVFEILLESCKGKSWQGKELIFEALVNYCIKLKLYLATKDDLLDRINKVVLTECKRKNKEYQKHAVKITGKFLFDFPNEEILETYLEIMSSILGDTYNEDSDDDDDDMKVDRHSNKRLNNGMNTKLEEAKLNYLTNVFDTFSLNNREAFELIYSSVSKLLKEEYKFEITWRSKIHGSEQFSKLIKKLNESEFEVDRLYDIWQLLNKLCSDFNNIENVKIKFIRSSKVFIEYLENLHYLEKVAEIKRELARFNNDSTVVKAEVNK